MDFINSNFKLYVLNYCESSIIAPSLVREMLAKLKINTSAHYKVILGIALGNINVPTLAIKSYKFDNVLIFGLFVKF